MAEDLPKYRFMPWSRQGLAAHTQQADTGGTLPARALLPVAITVSGASVANVNLSLYGPGDVAGIDSRVIIRTEPRAHTTDAEPNYLAAIEFDLPDLPWMFTPARADASQHLRPWCVLIVLDQSKVPAPKVNKGAPLPSITIPAEVAKTELPNLAESWAWAHVQALSESTDPQKLSGELASAPHLNVSRLLCPRRLEPNKHYYACLVPAFDLGVQRGLGATPSGNLVKPAWDISQAVEVKLPVYFHWEFGTGPAGDFESLARKLTPIKAPAKVGFQRMFIGEPLGGLTATSVGADGSYTEMEGVLRAPMASDSKAEDIPASLRTGIQKAVNASADLTGGTGLTPPLYGEWHLNRHRVEDAAGPPWLRELNVDPRMRAAAGLGAEIVRRNQEDFMQACWEQVGDVIKANALLNRARFAQEALQRLYERHFRRLPQDRLLQVSAPMHGRAPLGALTVRGSIARASLPNAGVDAALRRMVSPQRPLLKRMARRAHLGQLASRSARLNLTGNLSIGKLAVDPTQFTPDGLTGVSLLEGVSVPAGAAVADLASLGIQARLPTAELQKLTTLRTTLNAVPMQELPRLQVRPDLATQGVVLDAQFFAPVGVQPIRTSTIPPPTTAPVTSPVAPVAPVAPITSTTGRVGLNPIRLTAILSPQPAPAPSPIAPVAAPPGAVSTIVPPIAHVTRPSAPVIMPPGTVGPIFVPPTGPVIGPVVRPPVTTIPFPTRITQATIISRYQNAFSQMISAARINEVDPQATFVAFDVKTARDELVKRMDPSVMVPRRVRGMLSGEGGASFESLPGIIVSPQFDRVMAAPDIDAPMYTYLAKYDRERFMPGVGLLPADSITLVETNPRFIESFMVGLNYEMSRELLWRGYPTDQRGTVMRHFWSWADGNPDLVTPIHQWTAGNLGKHVRGAGAGGQIVLLLRGQLLRRYPNTIIYAWKAKDGKLIDPPGPEDIREPVFRGQFAPDVSFAGFDLRDTDLSTGEGWFFVLQEQPTEPRFGFDETSNKNVAQLVSWSDAAWQHTGVQPGGHLVLAASPLKNKVLGGVQFGKNSAHLAHITIQKPMRVAIKGKHMVQE